MHGKHAPGTPLASHSELPIIVPSVQVHADDVPGMHVPPPPLSSSPLQAAKNEKAKISALYRVMLEPHVQRLRDMSEALNRPPLMMSARDQAMGPFRATFILVT
jgi:hypothetical protein